MRSGKMTVAVVFVFMGASTIAHAAPSIINRYSFNVGVSIQPNPISRTLMPF